MRRQAIVLGAVGERIARHLDAPGDVAAAPATSGTREVHQPDKSAGIEFAIPPEVGAIGLRPADDESSALRPGRLPAIAVAAHDPRVVEYLQTIDVARAALLRETRVERREQIPRAFPLRRPQPSILR